MFQTHHAWDGDTSRCEETLTKTLTELGVAYLDLFLIHWPFGFAERALEKPPGSPQPLRLPDGSPNPIWTIKVEYLKTWAAMESFVASGAVRSIGVSNFTCEQLDQLRSVAKIPPAVNQVELHPYLSQRELMAHCEAVNVRIMGYSPLGSSSERLTLALTQTLTLALTLTLTLTLTQVQPSRLVVRALARSARHDSPQAPRGGARRWRGRHDACAGADLLGAAEVQ